MVKRFLLSSFAVIGIVSTATAQTTNQAAAVEKEAVNVEQTSFMKRLDISVTAGSTGVGFELTTPICKDVKLRTGAAFMPHFSKDLSFGIMVGKYVKDPSLSTEENIELQNKFWRDNFLKLSDKLKGFTGITLSDNKLHVDATPNINNFKLLVDVYPFKNKKWHITGGFYWGNKNIAKAYPQAESMTPFLAVSMFNNLYKKSVGNTPIISIGGNSVCLPEELGISLQNNYGLMQVNAGQASHDIVATQDIYWDFREEVLDPNNENYATVVHESYDAITQGIKDGYYTQDDYEKAIRYHKGDVICKQDEYYKLTTDENGLITARASANSFKPYIGGGYETTLGKSGKTKIGVDAGILFWGGMPKVTTHNVLGVNINGEIVHDEIDFARDLYNIPTSIRPYVNFFKTFKVYPVVEVRLVQKIF